MISSTDRIGKNEKVSPKALRLLELVGAGYKVPPFLIITSEELGRVCGGLNCDRARLAKLVSEILHVFPCNKYAVRSSVETEDLENSSQAGQFKTVLNVAPSSLHESMFSVIQVALEKLPRGIAQCSIIVQEFIEPDYAGVIFTRNPIMGREMVVEYRHGVGDKVVGGEDVVRIRYLQSYAKQYVHALANIEELSKTASAIERMYNFPQDIEWAQEGGTTFILQCRPITSITKAAWEGIVHVESNLPSGDTFYYEKTSISETFPCPRPLALSILMMLYSKGGPVEKAYKHIGVKYVTNENLLHVFGNEVLVDRNIELQTLFPILGYKKANSDIVKWETWYGMLSTCRNVWALSRLSVRRHLRHELQIKYITEAVSSNPLSIEDNIHLLRNHYSSIFEINIFAQKALSNLKRHLGKDSRYLSGLLGTEGLNQEGELSDTSLRGNSINIDDNSLFMSTRESLVDSEVGRVTGVWWTSLPKWKQVGLTRHVECAKKYMRLRESARVLSVRLINCLRKSVEERGVELFPNTSDLIYFATINEILEKHISRGSCEDRKKLYEHYSHLVIPSYIASFVKAEKKTLCNIGVSPGVGQGVIVTKSDIESVPGKKILYTEILSPDLVRYFNSVVGIISKSGGMLSHLAIMAREAKIPVVVLEGSFDVPVGSVGSIDGLTGELKVF